MSATTANAREMSVDPTDWLEEWVHQAEGRSYSLARSEVRCHRVAGRACEGHHYPLIWVVNLYGPNGRVASSMGVDAAVLCGLTPASHTACVSHAGREPSMGEVVAAALDKWRELHGGRGQ